MPIVSVSGTDLTYDLIAYDDAGQERQDDPDGVMSRRAIDSVTQDPITDVFLFSHGWMGDLPAALTQYGNWIGAMMQCPADIAKLQQARPGFRPLLIGMHWPSLPLGDDSLSAVPGAVPVAAQVDAAAAKTADTPAARDALHTIFSAALSATTSALTSLPSEVADAYHTLDREMGLGSKGVSAAPGADREPFDPQKSFQTAPRQAMGITGSDVTGTLLSPLRTLSFWEMKDRAKQFGEGGAHQFLGALMQATGTTRGVKFHLMGHSFGCIVASAMAAGPVSGALNFQVDSLALVQGALALWSYCSDIPAAPGQPGYFRRLLDNHRVRGPIFTTRSTFDRAVGTWYPWAAGVAHEITFLVPELPEYGALGAFGIGGPGVELFEPPMLTLTGSYGFEAGKLYNIEASQVIRVGGGFAGAHNDISHPEVAHAVWEAALV